MQGARCSYHILMKVELSRQIFEKSPNIKFHEIRPVGDEFMRMVGRTDRQTWRS